MAFIEAQQVRFSYDAESVDAREVLHGVDLSIEEGEFVALLGHNGCGKSTMAKLFNGMLVPTAGKVLVGGIDTSVEETQLDVRRQVGLVLQNPDNQLVAGVVEEDVAFGPENLGVPPEEIRRRVDAALKAVDMYEYREHAPTNFPEAKSSGWPLRVSSPWRPSASFWTSPPPCWTPGAAPR